MRDLYVILDGVYAGQERVSQRDLVRHALAAGASAGVMDALDRLPEGAYSYDEVAEALGQVTDPLVAGGPGVPASQLTDDDLLRELAEMHRTRDDTLRHGSEQALERHTERQSEFEREYLRRYPEREVDAGRLRAGARLRAG